MMKKAGSFLLTLTMALTLAACGGGTGNDSESQGAGNSSPVSETPAPDPLETPSEMPEEQPDPSGSGDEDVPTVLVAYFSATGNTEGIARQLQTVLDADLYEILPAQPYTEEDLNYSNDDCRANREQNDLAARPAIDGSVENMEQYQVVFLGYPIWWGDAPRIISTFLESYDFTGKTIVPFCTSGSSGIAASEDSLAALAEDAVWLEGERFNAGASQEDIAAWVDGLGLSLS